MDNIASMHYDVAAVLENQILIDTIRKINDLREEDHEVYNLLRGLYNKDVCAAKREDLAKLESKGLIYREYKLYNVTKLAIKLHFI